MAVNDPSNTMIQYYNEPGEFTLFENSGARILDLDSEATVEICVNDSRHVTGMNVSYDGMSSNLRPGNCRQYTARHFEFSPAGSVDENWAINGTLRWM